MKPILQCVVLMAVFLGIGLQASSKSLRGTYDGRAYGVYLPDGKPPKGVVFVLHGFKGSGKQVRRSSGFDAWAKRHGVAAVYPNAVKAWNDGRGKNEVISTDQDDVGYLTGLAQMLAAQGVIPSAKIHVIGFSNGGGMAMRMACQRPDMVRGLAVVTTKEFVKANCAAYRPVPAVFFFGTEDRLSLHEGDLSGTEGVSRRSKGGAYSADQTIAKWRTRNGCKPTARERTFDRDTSDGTTVTHFSFVNCAKPLEYYRINGGGHTWPGGRGASRPIATRILGKTSKDINANDIALTLWFGRS